MLLLIVMTRRGLRARARFGRAGVLLLVVTIGGLLLSYVFLSAQTGSAYNGWCCPPVASVPSTSVG